MNIRVVKILFILILCALFFFKCSQPIYASYSIDNIFIDAQDFTSAGNDVGSTINTTALHETSNFLYKLLWAIGLVVALAVGIILGIQFMVASAEDKAKIKETLIAYVVGCIVLFGAYGIWRFVVTTVEGITTVKTGMMEQEIKLKDSTNPSTGIGGEEKWLVAKK